MDALVEVATGKCPLLIVLMPPQHGKSQVVSQYFPSWFLGTFPDRRVILASYEADFAASWGRRTRDILTEHGEMFGIRIREDSHAVNRWEIEGRQGGMVTAGIGGPITGKSADLAIIDDPVKNAEEAASEAIQRRNWDWYQSALMTRIQKGGGVVLNMTRWNVNDLAGKVIADAEASGKKHRVIRFPAIAEEDEDWGFWKRRVGDALCPELHDLDELRERERSEYWWASLYQQRPFQRTSGFFKREWFEILDEAPADLYGHVRYWDLAASKTGKRTAGVLMARRRLDGSAWVLSVVKGKWTPGARDQVIRQTAGADGRGVMVAIEQEPGSGGIAQNEAIAKMLAGWNVRSVPASGDKAVRAGPFSSFSERGLSRMVRGPWNGEYLDELEAFDGKNGYMDQVDASSGAFQLLTGGAGRIPVSTAGRASRIDAETKKVYERSQPRSVRISDFIPKGGPS